MKSAIASLLLAGSLWTPAYATQTETLVTVTSGPVITTPQFREACAVLPMYLDPFVKSGEGEGGEEAFVRRYVVMLALNRQMAAEFDKSGAVLPDDVLRKAQLAANLSLVRDEQRERIEIPAKATVEELRAEYDRIRNASAQTTEPLASFENMSSRLRAGVERAKQKKIRDALFPQLKQSLGFEAFTSSSVALTETTGPLFMVNKRGYSRQDLLDFARTSQDASVSTGTRQRFEEMALLLESARSKGLMDREQFRSRLQTVLDDAKTRYALSRRHETEHSSEPLDAYRLKALRQAAKTMSLQWNDDALAPYAL